MSLSIDNNNDVFKALIEPISQITDNDANKVIRAINRHKLNPYENVTKARLLEKYQEFKNAGIIALDQKSEDIFSIKNIKKLNNPLLNKYVFHKNIHTNYHNYSLKILSILKQNLNHC